MVTMKYGHDAYEYMLTDSRISGTDMLALMSKNCQQNIIEGYVMFSVRKSVLAGVKRLNHASRFT